MFKIIKRGENNFWHVLNNNAKEVSISDFEVVLDAVANTFVIVFKNGANLPSIAVNVLDIIVIDETDSSAEYTFTNVVDLRDKLVILGYTAYLGAGNADSITGLIIAGTNVTITGSGTLADPYVINSSGGGGGSVTADDVTETATRVFVTPSEKAAIGLKEDSSNKSTSTSDSASTTKFPVWSAIVSYITSLGYQTASNVNSLITSALTSFKTTNFLDFTSSGQTQIDSKAPLASPTFTGIPTAPTPTIGSVGTQIATKEYVLANAGVTSTGTTNRIPKFTSSNSLGDSGLIQVGGNIGMGSAVVPGELFHIGDGNILLEGGGEVAQKFKRDFTTTGENLGVPTGSGISVNPIFQVGRIIQAGDGDPEIRIMYSDDNTSERTVFEVDRKGIAASVKTSIGSHFEGFASLTDVNPKFRLNSYPRMRLEMGAGGNDITDVAVERGATGSLDFFTNSAYRGGFDSSGNLNLLNTPTAPTPTAGSVGTQIATKEYVLANSGGATPQVKTYKGLVSYSGTGVQPFDLVNTIGIIWSKPDIDGVYYGTFPYEIVDKSKIFCLGFSSLRDGTQITDGTDVLSIKLDVSEDINGIWIKTLRNGIPANDVLYSSFWGNAILIEDYN